MYFVFLCSVSVKALACELRALARTTSEELLSLNSDHMLRCRLLQRPSQLQGILRSYARPASTHALLFIEHRDGVLDSGSLSL